MAKTTLTAMKPVTVKQAGQERESKRFLLKGVWFYYCATSPRLGEGKKFNKHFPAKDSHYGVNVLLSDRSVLKTLKDKKLGFGKVTTETVDAADFEDKFKCQPPFEADEYHFLKLSRHAAYGDGATWDAIHTFPIYQIEEVNGKRTAVKVPFKTIKAVPCKDHDEKRTYDVKCPDIMIGNGSFGNIIIQGYFYVFKDALNTKPIQEQIFIEDLVEYKSSGKKPTTLEDDELAALGLEGVEDTPDSAVEEASDKGNDEPPFDTDDDEEDFDDESESEEEDEEDDEWETN